MTAEIESDAIFDSALESVESEKLDNSQIDDKHDEKSPPRGYMSKEAWIESGKDPEKWVSPEVFAERGERIKMKIEMQRDFDNRLKNMQVLHQAQLRVQREELVAKRDEAIESADKAAVKGYDKQLKELDKMEELVMDNSEQATAKKSPEIIEWEAENPWINDPSDVRTSLAQSIFIKAIEEGKTHAGALRAVDREIAAKFIDKSRKPAQIAESSRPSSGGDKGRISMSNLTPEEKKIWDTGMFSSQEKFLKAVEDERKAKKL